MNTNKLEKILEEVSVGKLAPKEAMLQIKMEPYRDIGFAKIDSHRGIRQGVAEVIYGSGKSGEQIVEIVSHMRKEDMDRPILITRLDADKAKYLADKLELTYDEVAKIGVAGNYPSITGTGTIVVATAGTSDISVAEETVITAQALGNEVVRLYDVGVAGLHRLLDNIDIIMKARVIVAVAGMEGALASVIGGIASCPVIAVPTSIGYGANFNGLSALLSMLNSCSSGVSVVNIDNGFGAGYLASMINHIEGSRD